MSIFKRPVITGTATGQLESFYLEGEVVIVWIIDQESKQSRNRLSIPSNVCLVPVVDVLLDTLGVVAVRHQGTGLVEDIRGDMLLGLRSVPPLQWCTAPPELSVSGSRSEPSRRSPRPSTCLPC